MPSSAFDKIADPPWRGAALKTCEEIDRLNRMPTA